MPSVFADEWRDCLRAHYMHVVRTQDTVTLKSLLSVMHEAGFGEDELRALQVRATMHVDEIGADFVPDLEILQTAADNPPTAPATPPEPAPPKEGPTQLSLF
ncbi:MAG: hypothetical protein HXY40_13750 [Chloroflexi bacterium]|nr:hypothetical protein [Chloroflexota bacterium]